MWTGTRVGRVNKLQDPEVIQAELDARSIAANPVPYNMGLEKVEAIFKPHAQVRQVFFYVYIVTMKRLILLTHLSEPTSFTSEFESCSGLNMDSCVQPVVLYTSFFIFIWLWSNLSYGCMFVSCQVKSVRLPKHKGSKIPSGFAVVEFFSKEEAEKVLKMELTCDGVTLELESK
jgi:hypothetical protein